MNVPRNISDAVTGKRLGMLHVKTFIFELAQAESGDADDTVNAFCEVHGVMSIVLDRHNSKLIYRIIYKDR